MNIGFICNEYPPGPHGGIGTFVQLLARRLVEVGHSVCVTGMYPAGHSAADYEVDQGVRVWRWRRSSVRLGWLTARYRLWKHVRSLAQSREIEVVEAPDWEGWCAGWPRLPIPVVVRLHGASCYFAAEIGRPYKRTEFLLEQWALQRADDWCSVSRYTADKTKTLFKLRRNDPQVIYNTVERVTETSFSSRNDRLVLFTGTLTAKKGIISLIRAWPEVRRRFPDAELRVLGKDGRTDQGGSMREHLLGLVGDAAAMGVSFGGHVAREEVFRELSHARAAVFPSYAEAFALAPLESMAAGCPTIVTNRGSGPELVTHGENGLLVDPDSPKAIAASIVRLLSDAEEAKRLSEQGRLHVRREFSLDRLLEQNLAFYQQAIACKADRGTRAQPCESA